MTSRAVEFPSENASQPQAIERAADWQVEESHFLSGTASFLSRVKLKLKSDEELVVLLQTGDADVLTVLFERYSALIFRIARRILGNDAEAEDAVQEVFLDFFRSADKFDPFRGTFKAWLLMFAYCRTINHKSRLTSRHFYETDSLDDIPEELLAGCKRAFPFNAGETKRIVDEALGSIQPRQRRTIELVYYEGLSRPQREHNLCCRRAFGSDDHRFCRPYNLRLSYEQQHLVRGRQRPFADNHVCECECEYRRAYYLRASQWGMFCAQ